MPINCEVVQWSESVQWHLAWILEDPTAELLGEAHQNTTRVPVHNTLTNTRLSSPFNEGLLNTYIVYEMEHKKTDPQFSCINSNDIPYFFAPEPSGITVCSIILRSWNVKSQKVTFDLTMFQL